MNPTRRRFIEVIPLAGAASWLVACSDKAPAPAPMAAPAPPPAPVADAAPASPAAPAPATTATLVDEKEPAAVALGYVTVASRADTTRYKTHAADQACGGCALYGGKPGDATGPCPLFAGRLVAGPGWCNGYVKKTT